MKILRYILSFAFLTATSFAAPRVFVANDYGAQPGGTTLNTIAIQRAIDEAAHSGGTITLKPGVYLTGSIFLRSGTHLHLDKGVTLIGIQKLDGYPLMPTRVAGIEMSWPAALVNIYKQTNVVIDGEGTIDGDGSYWWKSYWDLRKTYEPRGLRWASDYDARRPRLIQVFDSSNVKIGGGLQLRRSGFWTMHICYSRNVTIDGVTIRNNEGGKGPSTDGIDIDSSEHILVAHADIDVNDDALCLKAGRDADGLRVNRPTEHVVLRDSIIRSGAAAVTIGSETSGGFRDIEAYNLTGLEHVSQGVLFKSAATRGGFADNVRIHDLTLTGVRTPIRVNLNWNPAYSYTEIPKGETNYPEYWRTLTTKVPADKGIPRFTNIHIRNIKATSADTAIQVAAYPQQPLLDFDLANINIQARTAGSIEDAQDWRLSNITIATTDDSKLKITNSTNITGEAAVHYTHANVVPRKADKSDAQYEH